MSAERMAEIEARLREFGGRHPHYNDYVRAERAFVTYAPIDLRWLLDRVRELEGVLAAIETHGLTIEADYFDTDTVRTFSATQPTFDDAPDPRFLGRTVAEAVGKLLAARSPSGEGQP